MFQTPQREFTIALLIVIHPIFERTQKIAYFGERDKQPLTYPAGYQLTTTNPIPIAVLRPTPTYWATSASNPTARAKSARAC